MLILDQGRLSTLTGHHAVRVPDYSSAMHSCGVRLLNHLVRANEDGLRDRKAERLRGLQIDD
jgi:hypothetical protein